MVRKATCKGVERHTVCQDCFHGASIGPVGDLAARDRPPKRSCCGGMVRGVAAHGRGPGELPAPATPPRNARFSPSCPFAHLGEPQRDEDGREEDEHGQEGQRQEELGQQDEGQQRAWAGGGVGMWVGTEAGRRGRAGWWWRWRTERFLPLAP